MRNLIDMTIDVEPLRYGTFDVRIVEIGKHYECDLYIDNDEVECSIDIPTRDDKEDEAMQKRIIAAALEEYPGQIEGFNRFVNIECDGDYEYAMKTLLNRNGLVASGSLSNYNKRVKRNIEASPKDMFTYEGITKKYGKKNLLNEMSIESFNTKVAKDFVAMVLQYVNDEPDVVVNYNEFNYGEYESWAKAYPELANLCMVGGNNVSDAADELLDALLNFIRVAQRNTITSTHRREFKQNDVEAVEEGVDTGQYLSAQERRELSRNHRSDRDEDIYSDIKRLRRMMLNATSQKEEEEYAKEIDRLKRMIK